MGGREKRTATAKTISPIRRRRRNQKTRFGSEGPVGSESMVMSSVQERSTRLRYQFIGPDGKRLDGSRSHRESNLNRCINTMPSLRSANSITTFEPKCISNNSKARAGTWAIGRAGQRQLG